jgi:glutamine cyclotransferase
MVIVFIYFISNQRESPTLTDSINSNDSNQIQVSGYKIINTYPHDQDAYTQGLVFDNGFLYEGTGLYGKSTLRKVDLNTGKINKIRKLPAEIFGEGITIHNDKIIQLTWKSNIGYVYDKETFELLEVFNYSTDGWGITHNGTNLIISNGSSILHALDPGTFEKIGEIKVFDNNGPVSEINELEYVRGEIYANIWKTDRIARIDPKSGQVLGWIELEGLTSDIPSDSDAVLNGIAYDEKQDRLFVTGKLYPKIFEIELT